MLALICRRFFALWAFMHALLSRAYRFLVLVTVNITDLDETSR